MSDKKISPRWSSQLDKIIKPKFLITPEKAWTNMFKRNDRVLKNFAPSKDDRDGYVR